MELLTDKYASKIEGALSCYDRIVISGTLPVLSNTGNLGRYFIEHGIWVYDYAKFAEPLTVQTKENAELLAKEAGIKIEYINRKNVVKEEIVSKKIKERGDHPGLVHIIAIVEGCSAYKPACNKPAKKVFFRYTMGKCLVYYFYFIDELLGMCYVRVPSWLPFQLQIYFNGHCWLANRLKKKKINYDIKDNAFLHIDDWQKAQKISDHLELEKLHTKLDSFALKYCPAHQKFNQKYYWSIMQCEYSTDVVFKRREDLKPVYEGLITTAIHTISPENVATFLGKKVNKNPAIEIATHYNVRNYCSRIKHKMGKVSIKMYDKFGQMLRIETTVNDVSFFRIYREVIKRDGASSQKYAPMKKNMYSLSPLREILKAANYRYLEFLSAIEDNSVGYKKLEKATEAKIEKNRKYKGFNIFEKADKTILEILSRGEFNIYGFSNKDLKKWVDYSSSKLSRVLKRLRVHGLIKKARGVYKYYLTKEGKQFICCSQKIVNMVMIPSLSKAA